MLASGTRLGSYEILSALGAGGMGEVYEARDTRLKRRVAIKVIPADRADAGMIRRFEDEALSASALNHPNILTVHEYGSEQGVYFLVTELVEGESLRQMLSRGALPVPRALAIAIEVASALEAAHAAGIVHRDIKPENIMIRPDGYVKVLDFGLAKVMTPAQDATQTDTVSLRTVPGMILGTLAYMPPEQVRGLPVDVRADIWSVGAVLHEMVTGEAAFTGATSSDVIAAVLERQAPSLASRGVQGQPQLERILDKALAKDPGERYQTARDLLIDLKRVRDEDAVSHSAATALSREDVSSRRSSRMRLVIALSAAAVLLITSALAWRIGRAREAAPASAGRSANAPVQAGAAPARTLTYWLTVQRMRGGRPYQAPFESAGLEIFDSGDKFSLHVQSPEKAYLYLLNQGPAANGRETLTVLYPSPTAGMIGANEIAHAGWYYFDPNPGLEQFWVIWSVEPVAELTAALHWVNPTDQGFVKSPQEANAIQGFLKSHESPDTNVVADRRTGRTVVTGHGNVVVRLIQLSHH